jgi:hypothetical protein
MPDLPIPPTPAPAPPTPPPAPPAPPAPPTPAKRESAVDAIGRKIEAIKRGEDPSVTPEQIAAKAAERAEAQRVLEAEAAAEAAAKKPTPTPEPTPTPTPTDTNLPTPPGPKDDSDAAIQAEVEVKMKGQPGEVKAAFAEARYAERALRRELNKAKPQLEKVTQLETELAEAKKNLESATNSPEVQTLKERAEQLTKDVAERDARLAAYDVTTTPDFQREVTDRRSSVNSTLTALATKHEISPAELIAAVNDTSDAQSDKLATLTEGMNRFEIAKVDNAIGEILKANQNETTLKANAQEALKKIRERDAAVTQTNTQSKVAERKAAHTENWKTLATVIPEVLTPVEGTDEVSTNWNKAQVEAKLFAEITDFDSMDAVAQNDVIQRAAVFPLLAGALKSMQKQLDARVAAHEADLVELGKFRAAVPGPANPREPGSPAAKNEPTDWAERVSKKLGQVSGR